MKLKKDRSIASRTAAAQLRTRKQTWNMNGWMLVGLIRRTTIETPPSVPAINASLYYKLWHFSKAPDYVTLIVTAPRSSPEMNPEVTDWVMHKQWCPHTRTIICGILKLPLDIAIAHDGALLEAEPWWPTAEPAWQFSNPNWTWK